MDGVFSELKKKLRKSLDDFSSGANNFNPIADKDPNQAGRQNFWTTQAPKIGQTVMKTASQAGQAIKRNPVTDFFNPNVSGTKGFWSEKNPVAMTMSGRTQLPKVRLKPFSDAAERVKNPILRFGAQAGVGAAEDLLNTPRNLVQAPINIARDVNIGEKDPRKFLADAAPFAEGMLNVGTLGGGTVVKDVAKQGFKQGMKIGIKRGVVSGAKYGGAYGAISGVESGRDMKKPSQYAQNLALNTGVGMAGGAAIGGVAGGVPGLAKESLQKTIKKLFPSASDLHASQMADEYIKKAPGRLVAMRDGNGRFAGYTDKPFIPAGKGYAVAPKEMKINDWMSSVDREIKDNFPQPGLSIKIVKPDQLHQLQRGGAAPSKVMHFAETPGIENDLRNALAGASNAQDETKIIGEFTDQAIKSAKGNSLKATRAALNKEMAGIAGEQGNYKSNYAAMQALKNDPDIGPRLNALEDSIARIDEVINRPSVKKIVLKSSEKENFKDVMLGNNASPETPAVASAVKEARAAQQSTLAQPLLQELTRDANKTVQQVARLIDSGKRFELYREKGIKSINRFLEKKGLKYEFGKVNPIKEDMGPTYDQNIAKLDKHIQEVATLPKPLTPQQKKLYSRDPWLEKYHKHQETRRILLPLYGHKQMLTRLGYSYEQRKGISAPETRKIIEKGIKPQDFTSEVRKKLNAELEREWAAVDAKARLQKIKLKSKQVEQPAEKKNVSLEERDAMSQVNGKAIDEWNWEGQRDLTPEEFVKKEAESVFEKSGISFS